MAHFERFDIDTTTGENFMYYLQTRAFNLEDLEIAYEAVNGPTAVITDTTVLLSVFTDMFQAFIGIDSTVTRLTDDETRRFFNHIKYEFPTNFANLTRIDLARIDYGREDKRRSVIHWRLFLDDFEDCDFQYLQNDAQITGPSEGDSDALSLVNFPCQYEGDDVSGITTAKLNYHSFLTDFVNEVDKKIKERITFKNFIKDFTISNNKQQVHDDFFSDLENNSGTIHTHIKNNVISRLVQTKRYKRRVLAKLPPFA